MVLYILLKDLVLQNRLEGLGWTSLFRHRRHQRRRSSASFETLTSRILLLTTHRHRQALRHQRSGVTKLRETTARAADHPSSTSVQRCSIVSGLRSIVGRFCSIVGKLRFIADAKIEIYDHLRSTSDPHRAIDSTQQIKDKIAE